LQGLAVQARVLGFNFDRAWDEPSADLDWDIPCVRAVVENLCALVGVDRVRPASGV
jgi:hypothetical protein